MELPIIEIMMLLMGIFFSIWSYREKNYKTAIAGGFLAGVGFMGIFYAILVHSLYHLHP